MKVKLSEIIDKLNYIKAELVGNDQEITRVSSLSDASPTTLCFVNSKKFLNEAIASNALCFVIPYTMRDQISENFENKSFILTDLPELYISKVLHEFFHQKISQRLTDRAIHSSAIIGQNCKISESANIGPFVVIGDNTNIEDNVYIAANVVIGNNCKISHSTEIHSQSIIFDNVNIGAESLIMSQTTIGNYSGGAVEIQSKVDIGGHCYINGGDQNTTCIEEGSKLDNNVYIGANTKIGAHSLLTAGNQVLDNCNLGHHFIAGGNCLVESNVNIPPQVLLGGLSYVDSDIASSGQYGGNPLQSMKEYLKTTMSISHLPEIRKKLKSL